nr:hypothetical protein [Tanacetum cinerariifolium]
SSQAPKRIDKGKKIATDDVESQVKLVPASRVVRVDPDEPIRVPCMINGKMHYLANDKITAHMEKEELIKKVVEQARLFAITKPEVVKVVREEVEKIGIDPEIITSAKEGEKFKKAQDTKLKREIIPKNKNVVVKELMNSLSRRYERIKEILKKLRIQSALPASILEQALSKSSRRKRKHMELEREIKVPGLDYDRSLPEAFQRWNDIHKVEVDSLVSYLVMASMIKTLENGRFYLKLKKLIAEHPDQEKLKSKRVKLEAL